MNPVVKTAGLCVASGLLGGMATLGLVSSRISRDTGADPSAPVAVTLAPGGHERGTRSESAALGAVDPRISLRQLAILASRDALADPEAAVKRAREIRGHESREIYLGEVLRVWGETDGKAAAAFASESFSGRELSDALYFIADGWAEVDPAGTAEWFRENTEGPIEDDAIWEALESWGRKDPGAAFSWVTKLDEYSRANALQGLAEGWGAIDPAAAARAGMDLADESHRRDFLVTVGMQWAGQNPEEGAAWAMSLENERLRGSVIYEMSDIWSRSDPRKAAAWTATIADPGAREVAEEGLAKGWSIHDPAGALEWALGTLQPPARLEGVIGDIVFNWSNADPRGASAWLDRQPAGEKKDRVLGTYSAMVADDDPEAAVAWAYRISDTTLRETQLRALLQGMVANYGDWAYRTIEKLDLPESLRREFTRPEN
jgi:hypothetical protein